jgi:hypothetical protein
MGPDQDGHLDGKIFGLILLLNLMWTKAHIGVYLFSGGLVRALKILEDTEYARFCAEFDSVPSPRGCGTLLVDDMPAGMSRAEKLATAWSLYVRHRLEKKFPLWERAYIELGEFDLFLGSMSVFHFGSRFPLLFGDAARANINEDIWHARLHLYVGNSRVKDPSGQLNFKDAREHDGTIDIRASPSLQAALQYKPEPAGAEPADAF